MVIHFKDKLHTSGVNFDKSKSDTEFATGYRWVTINSRIEKSNLKYNNVRFHCCAAHKKRCLQETRKECTAFFIIKQTKDGLLYIDDFVQHSHEPYEPLPDEYKFKQYKLMHEMSEMIEMNIGNKSELNKYIRELKKTHKSFKSAMSIEVTQVHEKKTGGELHVTISGKNNKRKIEHVNKKQVQHKTKKKRLKRKVHSNTENGSNTDDMDQFEVSEDEENEKDYHEYGNPVVDVIQEFSHRNELEKIQKSKTTSMKVKIKLKRMSSSIYKSILKPENNDNINDSVDDNTKYVELVHPQKESVESVKLVTSNGTNIDDDKGDNERKNELNEKENVEEQPEDVLVSGANENYVICEEVEVHPQISPSKILLNTLGLINAPKDINKNSGTFFDKNNHEINGSNELKKDKLETANGQTDGSINGVGGKRVVNTRIMPSDLLLKTLGLIIVPGDISKITDNLLENNDVEIESYNNLQRDELETDNRITKEHPDKVVGTRMDSLRPPFRPSELVVVAPNITGESSSVGEKNDVEIKDNDLLANDEMETSNEPAIGSIVGEHQATVVVARVDSSSPPFIPSELVVVAPNITGESSSVGEKNDVEIKDNDLLTNDEMETSNEPANGSIVGEHQATVVVARVDSSSPPFRPSELVVVAPNITGESSSVGEKNDVEIKDNDLLANDEMETSNEPAIGSIVGEHQATVVVARVDSSSPPFRPSELVVVAPNITGESSSVGEKNDVEIKDNDLLTNDEMETSNEPANGSIVGEHQATVVVARVDSSSPPFRPSELVVVAPNITGESSSVGEKNDVEIKDNDLLANDEMETSNEPAIGSIVGEHQATVVVARVDSSSPPFRPSELVVVAPNITGVSSSVGEKNDVEIKDNDLLTNDEMESSNEPANGSIVGEHQATVVVARVDSSSPPFRPSELVVVAPNITGESSIVGEKNDVEIKDNDLLTNDDMESSNEPANGSIVGEHQATVVVARVDSSSPPFRPSELVVVAPNITGESSSVGEKNDVEIKDNDLLTIDEMETSNKPTYSSIVGEHQATVVVARVDSSSPPFRPAELVVVAPNITGESNSVGKKNDVEIKDNDLLTNDEMETSNKPANGSIVGEHQAEVVVARVDSSNPPLKTSKLVLDPQDILGKLCCFIDEHDVQEVGNNVLRKDVMEAVDGQEDRNVDDESIEQLVNPRINPTETLLLTSVPIIDSQDILGQLYSLIDEDDVQGKSNCNLDKGERHHVVDLKFMKARLSDLTSTSQDNFKTLCDLDDENGEQKSVDITHQLVPSTKVNEPVKETVIINSNSSRYNLRKRKGNSIGSDQLSKKKKVGFDKKKKIDILQQAPQPTKLPSLIQIRCDYLTGEKK